MVQLFVHFVDPQVLIYSGSVYILPDSRTLLPVLLDLGQTVANAEIGRHCAVGRRGEHRLLGPLLALLARFVQAAKVKLPWLCKMGEVVLLGACECLAKGGRVVEFLPEFVEHSNLTVL